MRIREIISGIDNDNQIRVEIELQGLYKTVVYGAIVDTGFSGSLVLPLVVAVDVGLSKGGATNVTLADGSIRTMPLFLSKVKIGDVTQDADTLIMGNDVLIGMGILDDYTLTVTPASGQVTLSEHKQPDLSNPFAKEQLPENNVSFLTMRDVLRRLTSRNM